ALGCGGTTASEPAASASSAATRAPVAQSAHGAVKLFGEALGDVPMTAAQRAQIEQLATEAEARHAGVRTAHQDLALALAAQVQTGTIDRAALGPKIDAVSAAMAASQPADHAGLEKLHAMLGPDQRSAFVDALKARFHDHAAEARGHHGMRDWAQELKLSDDQRTQIEAALKQHFRAAGPEQGDAQRSMGEKRRAEKWLDAFKQDRFVIDDVAPAQGNQGQKAIDWFLGVAEAALPVLTPEQRAMAAQKIRTRAEQSEGTGPMLP
ncbi:MAG TPA: Spy/CpxP family protein refolding chaperone, partial [Polyangiaceae bacterium]|nr:Spy/CpxP family protein refolding chaperone [Polyangiaceae bacterium]